MLCVLDLGRFTLELVLRSFWVESFACNSEEAILSELRLSEENFKDVSEIDCFGVDFRLYLKNDFEMFEMDVLT